MMTTPAALTESAGVKSLPLTIGIPRVLKYPGQVSRYDALGKSVAEAAARPSIVKLRPAFAPLSGR